MQKKIIGAILVLVLVAAGYFIIDNTRLFKESPNIIVILTDDMDDALMSHMEKTNRLIGDQGATFTNFIITTPACCPSRTSILRGQYSHNTEILENSPGFPLYYRLEREKDSLPVWLNNAGYQTAMFGKYMNNYPVPAGWGYVPPGWTDWGAFIGVTESRFYYDYILNENGTVVEYGNSSDDYSTDLIRDKSLQFIDRNAAGGTPFLLYISVYAPHGPSTPAPRHSNLFPDLTYPQKPSFAEEDISDKPEIVQALTEGSGVFDEYDANASFLARVRTMQAVDELVEDVVAALERNRQLENTYIIFTSDNGFRLGEHRIQSGKGLPYEEDIRVPFLMRGPGIAPGSQVTQLTANIDIAPTIADIVSVRTPSFVDGRSFLPLLRGAEVNWRKGLLIEFGYMEEEGTARIGAGGFRGIRTENFVFVEYENGELEYYDLIADPYQLENMAGLLSESTLSSLRQWLDQLRTCEARTCRDLEQSPPDGILD
jgi:N-acetylglucosamine-6-sulfatase